MTDVLEQRRGPGRPPKAIAEASDAPPASLRKTIKIDWLDMDDAPQDGKIIVMTPDGVERVEGLWRHSRSFDKQLGRWTFVGIWSHIGGAPLDFEPMGWLPREGI